MFLLNTFLPEIFLSISIFYILACNSLVVNTLKNNFPVLEKELISQFLFILICVFFILNNLHIESFLFNYSFVQDNGAKFLKILLIILNIFMLFFVWQHFIFSKLNFFEYFIIYFTAILASLLLFNAYDLLSCYLVLELQSICFYILASFDRNSSFSSESGLKYFISSALMSGVYLWGCSLIYGCLGTLNFNSLSLLLSISSSPYFNDFYYILYIGIFLVIMVLLFKLVVMPFHFWFPQIYDGAPLSSTFILSLLPKLTTFVFLFRFLICCSAFVTQFKVIFLIFGIFSMCGGTLLAIRQKRLKKLFIYSSIGQIGLPLCLLSTFSIDSMTMILFYVFIYLCHSVLMWNLYSLLVISYNYPVFFSDKKKNTFSNSLFLGNLSNFFKNNAIWFAPFLVLFFSSAGVPLLSGFLSKLVIFKEFIRDGQYVVALFLLFFGSFSVFYYIRILKIMSFDNTTRVTPNEHSIFKTKFLNWECFIIAFLTYFICFVFLFPDFFILYFNYIVLNFVSI